MWCVGFYTWGWVRLSVLFFRRDLICRGKHVVVWARNYWRGYWYTWRRDLICGGKQVIVRAGNYWRGYWYTWRRVRDGYILLIMGAVL